MTSPTPPKAILFDIGGVCVISPFQAILDYERENNIPIGYINHAIQRGPPDTGAWQLIERGAVPLDSTWFASFQAQLSHPDAWHAFLAKKGLVGDNSNSSSSSSNTTTTTTTTTTPNVPTIDAQRLFWRMMRISRTPDPYMYPALRRLGAHRGRFVLGALSNTVHFPTGVVDDEGVVFEAGLVFEEEEEEEEEERGAGDSTDIRTCFDVFVSSAHAGVRKPEPGAYELAVGELSRKSVERGLGEVRAGDVLFLDDIGVNLKWARKSGLRTIKVDLGRTKEAVRALEEATGCILLDEKARL